MTDDAYAAALALRLEGKTYREIGQALGVTRQRAQVLISPLTATEDAVVARAAGRCEGCLTPAGRSGHIHHRQAKGVAPEAYNAEPNLTLLCISCHRKAHRADDTYTRRQKRDRPESIAERRFLTQCRRGATRLGIPVEEYRAHREAGERWCSWHRAWEPSERFGPSGGKLSSRCREGHRQMVKERQTREYRRDYYRRNAERLNAYRAEWQRRKKERRESERAS